MCLIEKILPYQAIFWHIFLKFNSLMFILIIFNLFLYIEWGRNLFVFYLFMCILFIYTLYLYFIYLHIVFVFYLTWVANYLSLLKAHFSPKGLYLAHINLSFTYICGLLFPSPNPPNTSLFLFDAMGRQTFPL